MEDDRFAEYLPGIRRRWIAEQRGWQLRRARAWEHARRAAEVLRAFGATRVLAFGSLTRTGIFDPRSDIDLAEEGIPPQQFFDAYAAAIAAADEFALDVVDLSRCSPRPKPLHLGFRRQPDRSVDSATSPNTPGF